MKKNITISLLIQLVTLLVLQIIIASQQFVLFGGLGFCFVYVLFLLQLPITLGRVAGMSIAFFVGTVVDIFYNTSGINAAACVLIMYLRPNIITTLTPQTGLDNIQSITISSVGYVLFSIYALVMVFIHHLTLFFLHTYSSTFFWTTLSKSIVSTLFTYVVIIAIQYLFFTERRRR